MFYVCYNPKKYKSEAKGNKLTNEITILSMEIY